MDKVVWDEQYNIGVEVVDKAHAKLFRIVGKLTDLVKDTQSYQHACEEGIKYIEDYSMKHFSEEEAYMRSIRYKGYAWHKQIHDNFRDKTLVSLRRDLKLSNYSPMAVQRFQGVMIGWLTGHIMAEDQAIVGKVPNKKMYTLSSRTATIAKAVDRAMQDIFRLEAKLVSDTYDGHNVGKEFFYCRLCYDIKGGGTVQLLLGVEEPLILRGVSQMLGINLKQKNIMVDEAALQIFQQLFRHMGRLFGSETEYQLCRNDLLDKDEFRADFMKGYPCSMLFNTKLGSFVFCFRSWRANDPRAVSCRAKV